MISAPVRCLMPARKRSSMTSAATATPPKRSLTVRIGSAPRRRSRPSYGRAAAAWTWSEGCPTRATSQGRSSSADPNFAGASPRATTSRSRLYTVRKLRSVNLVNGSTICATTPWSRASIASPRSGILAISCATLSACWSLSRKPLRTASTLCAASVRFRATKSLYVLMKMKPMMAISSTAPPITGSNSLRRSDGRSAPVRRVQSKCIQDRMRRLATGAHSIRRFGSNPAYHVVEALRPLNVTCRRQPLEDLVVDVEEGRFEHLTGWALEGGMSRDQESGDGGLKDNLEDIPVLRNSLIEIEVPCGCGIHAARHEGVRGPRMAPEKDVAEEILFVVDSNRLQIRTGKDETTRRLFADEPHTLVAEVVDGIDVVPRSQRNDHSLVAVDAFGVRRIPA